MKPWIWAALPMAALLGGCSGSSDSPGTSTGTLKIGVVDAPVADAKNVFVQFSGIELQGPDGRVTQTFAAPKKIDLLAFSGTNSTSLFQGTLTAGNYQWIRLIVDTAGSEDTYLVDASDAKRELTIPSADETGLKLVRGFTLGAGGTTDFTIDFDLRKSLVQDSNGYKLKPALRIVDSLQTGTLSGTLAPSSCAAGVTPVVYVFSGSAVTPDDIKGAATDPLATAMVNAGAYTVGFLPAGAYTVSFTCEAANDDPTTDDALTFATAQPASITARASTPVNF